MTSWPSTMIPNVRFLVRCAHCGKPARALRAIRECGRVHTTCAQEIDSAFADKRNATLQEQRNLAKSRAIIHFLSRS